MQSNYKDDFKVEREISKYLDSFLYPLVSSFFRRVIDKRTQKDGVDLVLENRGNQYLIDEKSAIYYANRALKSFAFETSYLSGSNVRKGWFLNNDLLTSHYNLVWLNTKDPKTKTNEITSEKIKDIEMVSISKTRIVSYLKNIGINSNVLEKYDYELRNSKSTRKSLGEGLELIKSGDYAEKSINLKINKDILIALAEEHYFVTEKNVKDLKRKSQLNSEILPNCTYSYLLKISSSRLLQKENLIRKLIKNGIKVIIFTDAEITFFEQSLYKSKLLHVYSNDTLIINDEFEIMDGKDLESFEMLSEEFPLFNIEQFKIEHEDINQNLIIKAGAGTGKTTVLVDRLIYLMTEGNIEPKNIVLVTFTRNSARVMFEKLKETLLIKFAATNNKKYLTSVEKLNDMRIQTISSFSKGLLKELGQLSGLGLSFKLRSFKSDKKKWIEEILDEMIVEYELENENIKKVISPLSYHEFIDCIYDFWDEFETNGYRNDEITHSNFGPPKIGEITNKLIENIIKNLVNKYSEELKKIDAISLNELTKTVEEIRREYGNEVFKNIQTPISYLFIDEFQDSDKSQIELFSAISSAFHSKIFVVGDTNQSIYRFRGAEHTAFELLKTKMNKKGFILNEKHSLIKNYRTTPILLDDIQRYFKSWKEKKWLHSNYRNLQGTIVNEAVNSAQLPQIVRVNKNKEDLKLEVIELITKRFPEIRKINKEKKISEKIKMAVITRTRAEAWLVNKWCKQEGIPVTLKVGGDFYTSNAVKDFNELLLFLLYPAELKFLIPVLEGPYGGKKIDFGSLIYSEGYMSVPESELDKHKRSFEKYLKDLRYKPVFTVLRSIIEETDLYNHVYSRNYRKAKEEYPSEDMNFIKEWAKAETQQYKLNMGKLFEILHQKFSEEFVTLTQIQNWLEVSLATERKESQVIFEGTHIDRVEIITAHGAKGLEYDTVVIPFTDRRFENNFSKILISKENDNDSLKVGWKIKKKDSLKENEFFSLMEKEEVNEVIGEESRLLYVAMTRAEKYLFILKNEINDKYNYTWSKLLNHKERR